MMTYIFEGNALPKEVVSNSFTYFIVANKKCSPFIEPKSLPGLGK